MWEASRARYQQMHLILSPPARMARHHDDPATHAKLPLHTGGCGSSLAALQATFVLVLVLALWVLESFWLPLRRLWTCISSVNCMG